MNKKQSKEAGAEKLARQKARARKVEGKVIMEASGQIMVGKSILGGRRGDGGFISICITPW